MSYNIQIHIPESLHRRLIEEKGEVNSLSAFCRNVLATYIDLIDETKPPMGGMTNGFN